MTIAHKVRAVDVLIARKRTGKGNSSIQLNGRALENIVSGQFIFDLEVIEFYYFETNEKIYKRKAGQNRTLFLIV